uniref:Ig-like domain-containing protein n=1 Tax=Calidris pygmaea TaxID=425635 RepID=A0A8C3PHQ1_9CHAR
MAFPFPWSHDAICPLPWDIFSPTLRCSLKAFVPSTGASWAGGNFQGVSHFWSGGHDFLEQVRTPRKPPSPLNPPTPSPVSPVPLGHGEGKATPAGWSGHHSCQAGPLPCDARKLTWVQPPSLCVLLCHPADFRVVGPSRPLLATVGHDIVLPCHLSPRMDARSLEIRWIRHVVSETVHLYRNGEDLYGEQMKEYAGRTALARDGLSSGSLDLRISELRPSDDGLYVCTVRDAGTYAEAMLEVEVAGLWLLWCVLGMFQMSVAWCVPPRALSHPHVHSFGAEGQEVWKEV